MQASTVLITFLRQLADHILLKSKDTILPVDADDIAAVLHGLAVVLDLGHCHPGRTDSLTYILAELT